MQCNNNNKSDNIKIAINTFLNTINGILLWKYYWLRKDSSIRRDSIIAFCYGIFGQSNTNGFNVVII